MADVFLGEETKNHRRAVKRKRIRRLIDIDVPEEGRKRYRRDLSRAQICRVERCSKRVFITCLLISLSVAILSANYFTSSDSRDGLVKKFINNYQAHYHQIVHGKHNYCGDSLNSAALTANIRQEQTILHQNNALQELEKALEANRRCTFIALVGPVGVGKTLYTDALQKYFPWQENLHSLVWNAFVSNEMEKYRNLRMIIENLSKCGVNLLIIRNLRPADKQIVDMVTKMVKEEVNGQQTRIVVLFVFNLNKLANEMDYLAQYQSLQNLNFTKTINFKSFGKKELEDCIRRETKLENMTLSHNTFMELLDTIDVERSGCKNVNAKVLAFGRKVSNSKTTEKENLFWTT